jgi:hypothetical protein
MLDDLLGYLASDETANVRQISRDELEVSLLGSYNEDAMRMEIYLRLRAWEAGARSGERVEIVD